MMANGQQRISQSQVKTTSASPIPTHEQRLLHIRPAARFRTIGNLFTIQWPPALGSGTGTLLPLPEIQLFGGGRHANGRVDVQDFMIVATGATTCEQALEMTFNVFHAAGDLLRERGLLAGVADEGGYWPVFARNEAVFEAMIESIARAGYEPGRQIAISLDLAASELYRGDQYRFGLEGRSFSSAAFAELLAPWVERYPILSIEDPAFIRLELFRFTNAERSNVTNLFAVCVGGPGLKEPSNSRVLFNLVFARTEWRVQVLR